MYRGKYAYRKKSRTILLPVILLALLLLILLPSVDNVIEVLVFLVTRHMILDHAGPASVIISVICILALYSFHFFVHYLRRKSGAFSEAVHGDASYIGGMQDEGLDEEETVEA